MGLTDAESARARGQPRRDGLVYIDLSPAAAQRVSVWQEQCVTDDALAPEWSSVARWQVAQALTLLGYGPPKQPVRYGTWARLRDSAHRTRLTLTDALAAACYQEALRLRVTLASVCNMLLLSLPAEPPTMPPRMTKAELDAAYKDQRVARWRELRDAARAGQQLARLKPGRKPTLPLRVAQVTTDVYLQRFLTLCAEREARDRWLSKGGRGKPPPCTVDDHLGRKRHSYDADAAYASRVRSHGKVHKGRKRTPSAPT